MTHQDIVKGSPNGKGTSSEKPSHWIPVEKNGKTYFQAATLTKNHSVAAKRKYKKLDWGYIVKGIYSRIVEFK